MTAIDSRPARTYHPNPIYPETYASDPAYEHCATCWQHAPGMAWIADPHGPGVIYTCPPCARALAAGHPVTLPTGHALVEVWERLARLHHNGNIGDEQLDRALADLAPHLSIKAGREAVEELQDMMLRLQESEDPMFDITTLEPEWRDAEIYDIHLRRELNAAMAKLTGGAR